MVLGHFITYLLGVWVQNLEYLGAHQTSLVKLPMSLFRVIIVPLYYSSQKYLLIPDSRPSTVVGAGDTKINQSTFSGLQEFSLESVLLRYSSLSKLT